ncbi:MAG: DNA replication/repair protein RecF [Bacilli bacterium]
MILKNIELRNFRNYEKLKLDLSEKINIFIGDNGAGKTNFLESIYMLAITKSHRIYGDKNVIKDKKINSIIKGRIIEKSNLYDLEIYITNETKNVSIDNNKISYLSDYISKFNVILFSPDDLELIKGAPLIRRKFLDIEISQIDNSYIKFLIEYKKILKIRNNYLKSITEIKYDEIYLNILNEKFCTLSSIITVKRKQFIDKLNLQLNNYFYKIGGTFNLKLDYITNINYSSFDSETIKKELFTKIKKDLKKEIKMNKTLYGIHRDDFIFLGNDKDIIFFGSQGQMRIAILALKLSEIKLFQLVKGVLPILLLDDIFSELDITKRNNILNCFDENIQIIITTTDLENIEDNLIKKAKIYKVYDETIEGVN